MHWLRTGLPNHWSYEIEARPYNNAKGVDEMIFLTRANWDYVDFLEAEGETNFADWVVHCDETPFEDWCLSFLLMYWLWTDECGRFRQGLPTPHPFPPMGYEGWADEYHAENG
jgi:hypothetical protein